MTEHPAIRFEFIEPGKLLNNAWNPNQMEQGEFDRLVKEIGDVGFIDPVQVIPLDDVKRFRDSLDIDADKANPRLS